MKNEKAPAPLTFSVGDADAGRRLDQFAADAGELTRSAAVRLIEEGAITCNGGIVPKKYLLSAGDRVEIRLPEPTKAEAQPQKIPLDVVYEDRDLIVINKPCGMVVHPAAGNPDGTLVNALLYHCGTSLSGIGGVLRPGIVHRIDKNTTGLLVVAKNDETHLALAEQLKRHDIRRIYTAVAIGNFREDAGVVNAPIGRHPTDRKRMAVLHPTDPGAREAVTHWRVLARAGVDGNSFALLRCELETGRTHQIRVHLSSIGHPLLGDDVYGGNHTAFEAHHHALIRGQCLHAGELYFVHPRTGEEMHLTATPPEELKNVIRILFGKELSVSTGKEDRSF